MRNVQSIETQRNRLSALVWYIHHLKMIFPFFSVMYIIKRSESVHMILVHVYYVERWFQDKKLIYMHLMILRGPDVQIALTFHVISVLLCITQGLSQVFEGSLYNIHNINKLKKNKLYKNKNDRRKLALFPHNFAKILSI